MRQCRKPFSWLGWANSARPWDEAGPTLCTMIFDFSFSFKILEIRINSKTCRKCNKIQKNMK
jgi:hypothetical protein